jgi:act minimal PKS acyl carrier protein
MTKITLSDLRQILIECAGEDEGIDLSGDIQDTPFTELGYDSLALIETAARIEQRFGVKIPDERIAELETPRGVLELVNSSFADAD